MDDENRLAEEDQELHALSETSLISIRHALIQIMRTPSFLLLRGLYLAFLIIGIVFLIQSLNPLEISRLVFASALILLAIGMYGYRFFVFSSKQAKKVMASRTDDISAVLMTRCIFGEDGILTHPLDGRESSLIEYADILKLFKDESYWILQSNQKKMLVLPRTSFDENQLEAFLFEKCPSLFKSKGPKDGKKG